MIKLTLKDLQDTAHLKGGFCLAKKYINSMTKILWKCGLGHTWAAVPMSVRRGSWCPQCAGRGKTVATMEVAANKRGGKCLSSQYNGIHHKLRWQCSEGHIWSAIPNSVLRGTWCPICANSQRNLKQKTPLKRYQKCAARNGGKCLSKVVENQHQKLQWECSYGHVWHTKGNNILQGQWCPICKNRKSSERQKTPFQRIIEIANSREGKCLSSEDDYHNQKSKLSWVCNNGHTWRTAVANIQGGSWCPICSSGLGERIVKRFFETILEDSFPKTKPKWLINKRGNRMELDGYCKKMGVAFEHQGEQHYTLSNPFIKDIESLNRRMEDDLLKKELCSIHDVYLVIVPEVPRLLPIKKLASYIVENLKDYKNDSVSFLLNKNKDVTVEYSEAYDDKKIKEIKKKAKKNGGELISKTYLGVFQKLEFKCSEDHIFKKLPVNLIHQDSWCPECSKEKRKELGIKSRKKMKDLEYLARKKGGKLISKESLGAHVKHRWICSNSHLFESSPANVLMGKWCPTCAKDRVKKNIIKKEQLIVEKLIKSKNGIMLTAYSSAKEKIKIQCDNNHVFETSPSSLKNGSWCYLCKGGKKYSIDEVNMLVNNYGIFTSNKIYTNIKTKMFWHCNKGHKFHASFDYVKRIKHCKICKNLISK